MSQNTVQLPEKIEAALAGLEAAPQFAPMVPMLREKFAEHYVLVRTNDSKIARINESKDTDPNSAEYQDYTWKRVAGEGSDKAIVTAEKRFQKIQKEHEEVLAQLRELAKPHMQPALSEDQVKELRKEVNEGKSALTDSAKALAGVADMANQMLAMAGTPIEAGILSLMPQPDSLMNARGRKAGSAEKRTGGYATRLSEAFVDDAPIFKVKRDKEGNEYQHAHFNHIAEALSREFNEKEFPENQITSEEVEKAYYDSKSVAFRDSGEMPVDHTYEFTKSVKHRNSADNSVKDMPITKKIRIVRWTKSEDAATAENADS